MPENEDEELEPDKDLLARQEANRFVNKMFDNIQEQSDQDINKDMLKVKVISQEDIRAINQ